MVPGDRLLCIFVKETPQDNFHDWPLHITVIPWFRAAMSNEALVERLSTALSELSSFSVVVTGEAAFGYKGRKTVNLLGTPSPIEHIEKTAWRILHESSAWIVDETTKVCRSFQPHVTMLKAGRVHEGDSILVKEVCIVEQKGEYKEIAGTISL